MRIDNEYVGERWSSSNVILRLLTSRTFLGGHCNSKGPEPQIELRSFYETKVTRQQLWLTLFDVFPIWLPLLIELLPAIPSVVGVISEVQLV